MLKSFNIEGLYGLFSYRLSLKKGVFLITGPNGFGKTTILLCINNIYDGNFWYFYYLKFKAINVQFDDGSTIELHRDEVTKNVLFGDVESEVTVKLLFRNGEIEERFDITKPYISRLARFQARRDPTKIEEYLEANYDLREDEGLQKAMPNMLSYFYKKNCSYLEAQRLVYGKTDNQSGIAYTIDDVNERIKIVYSKAHNDFSKTAQSIDGSFIKRLSELIGDKNKAIGDISASELQQKIKKYRKYHLIEEMNVEVQLPSSYDFVKNLYLVDIQSKLKSLEKYYESLSTFDQFVTGQGLSYKHIELGESGIIVHSDAKDEVPLNKLSSGEQNLMILAYHLIFEASEGDILLVDEPENSLHMSWLENLLEEYIRIARVSGIQVVIATHSPTFIGDREDLVYDLFDNNKA